MTKGNWDAPRYFQLHLRAFVLGTVVLVLIDFMTLEGWWFFWPTMVWGILVLLHGLYVKSVHVNLKWAEERTEDVRLGAYDLGHIESIEQRYKDGPPTGGATAKTENEPPSSEQSPSDRRAE